MLSMDDALATNEDCVSRYRRRQLESVCQQILSIVNAITTVEQSGRNDQRSTENKVLLWNKLANNFGSLSLYHRTEVLSTKKLLFKRHLMECITAKVYKQQTVIWHTAIQCLLLVLECHRIEERRQINSNNQSLAIDLSVGDDVPWKFTADEQNVLMTNILQSYTTTMHIIEDDKSATESDMAALSQSSSSKRGSSKHHNYSRSSRNNRYSHIDHQCRLLALQAAARVISASFAETTSRSSSSSASSSITAAEVVSALPVEASTTEIKPPAPNFKLLIRSGQYSSFIACLTNYTMECQDPNNILKEQRMGLLNNLQQFSREEFIHSIKTPAQNISTSNKANKSTIVTSSNNNSNDNSNNSNCGDMQLISRKLRKSPVIYYLQLLSWLSLLSEQLVAGSHQLVTQFTSLMGSTTNTTNPMSSSYSLDALEASIKELQALHGNVTVLLYYFHTLQMEIRAAVSTQQQMPTEPMQSDWVSPFPSFSLSSSSSTSTSLGEVFVQLSTTDSEEARDTLKVLFAADTTVANHRNREGQSALHLICQQHNAKHPPPSVTSSSSSNVSNEASAMNLDDSAAAKIPNSKVVSSSSASTNLRFLLQSFPMDVNLEDTGGKCALHYCTDAELVHILCDQPNVLLDIRDEVGLTPLQQYILCGHTDCARTILQYGANPNIAEPVRLRSSVHFAAESGCYELLNTVLTYSRLHHPVAVDQCDRNNNTALLYAAACMRLSATSSRSHSSSSCDSVSDGGNVDVDERAADTSYSIQHNVLKMILLLLDKGANASFRNKQGVSVLHLICYNRCLHDVAEPLVELLLHAPHFADPNAPDWDGCTPLIVACALRQFHLCKLLLEAGGDLNLQCRMNSTFLRAGFGDGDGSHYDAFDPFYALPYAPDQPTRGKLYYDQHRILHSSTSKSATNNGTGYRTNGYVDSSVSITTADLGSAVDGEDETPPISPVTNRGENILPSQKGVISPTLTTAALHDRTRQLDIQQTTSSNININLSNDWNINHNAGYDIADSKHNHSNNMLETNYPAYGGSNVQKIPQTDVNSITASDLMPKKPRYALFSSISVLQSKIRSVHRDRCMNCGDYFECDRPDAPFIASLHFTTGRHHCRHCRRVICLDCSEKIDVALLPSFVLDAYLPSSNLVGNAAASFTTTMFGGAPSIPTSATTTTGNTTSTTNEIPTVDQNSTKDDQDDLRKEQQQTWEENQEEEKEDGGEGKEGGNPRPAEIVRNDSTSTAAIFGSSSSSFFNAVASTFATTVTPTVTTTNTKHTDGLISEGEDGATSVDNNSQKTFTKSGIMKVSGDVHQDDKKGHMAIAAAANVGSNMRVCTICHFVLTDRAVTAAGKTTRIDTNTTSTTTNNNNDADDKRIHKNSSSRSRIHTANG